MENSESNNQTTPNAFQIAILIFTLVVLGALTADTIGHLPQQVSTLIRWLDTMACAVFFTDFCVRFFRAKSKAAFMRWGWVDLLASVPYLPGLRYARLARVLRVIRLLRGVRSVQRIVQLLFHHKAQTGAASLILMAFLLVAFSSVSILICEQNGDANIKTAEDAIWWSVSTLTTVGYGDKVPVTTEGRMLAMALMIAGVGMFGGLSGLTAALFLGQSERKSDEAREILARLDALGAKLDSLSAQQKMAETAKAGAAS
jgi:voltage-gated potassium channel